MGAKILRQINHAEDELLKRIMRLIIMIEFLPFELQREIYSYEHVENFKKVLYERHCRIIQNPQHLPATCGY